MARCPTGKRGLICTDTTYHGNSELVGALTRVGQQPTPNPSVRSIPFPEKYRPIVAGLSEHELCEAYLENLAIAIADLQASGEGVAAMIVCSILANEGLPDIPTGFMARAADMVRDARYFGLATRIAAEIGAHYVKSYFIEDGFERVVAGCPVPIVVAGGKKLPEREALDMAYRAVDQGAAGVDMGRNIFQSDSPVAMIQAVGAVVHRDATTDDAYQMYLDLKNDLEA